LPCGFIRLLPALVRVFSKMRTSGLLDLFRNKSESGFHQSFCGPLHTKHVLEKGRSVLQNETIRAKHMDLEAALVMIGNSVANISTIPRLIGNI
jgi:hypothetical protein